MLPIRILNTMTPGVYTLARYTTQLTWRAACITLTMDYTLNGGKERYISIRTFQARSFSFIQYTMQYNIYTNLSYRPLSALSLFLALFLAVSVCLCVCLSLFLSLSPVTWKKTPQYTLSHPNKMNQQCSLVCN